MVETALRDTLALPLGVALVVAGLAWLAGVRRRGLAGALGIAAGFAAGATAVTGVPRFPPVGAVEKVAWLGLLGLGGGLVAARMPDARWRGLVFAASAAVGVAWLGWARLGVPHMAAWLAGGLIVAAATWALVRATAPGGPSRELAALTGVAALTAAVVGVYGSSYALAQLVAVLAAALGGVLLMTGWRGRALGPAAHGAALVPLAGLVTILALYTRAEPLGLLLLVPVLMAGLVRTAVLGDGTKARHHAATAGFALLPAGVAVMVAVARSPELYM